MFFTLTNQQHYSTAPGSLETFFSFKTNSITSQLLVSKVFTIILRIFSSRNFSFSLTTNHQHYRTASGFFFLLREFLPRGFRYKLYFILKPSALPYSFWFFLEKFSLSNTSHQHYHTASGFPKHFITNHRHCHTASGFP